MNAPGDVAGDFIEMHSRRLSVGMWHGNRCACSTCRTYGAKEIGILVALIGRAGGAFLRVYSIGGQSYSSGQCGSRRGARFPTAFPLASQKDWHSAFGRSSLRCSNDLNVLPEVVRTSADVREPQLL